ncbi:MAG TPA: VWA domain-containing protein [Pyrinomonadaceae bacterium]|jgi:VWFA-related protein
MKQRILTSLAIVSLCASVFARTQSTASAPSPQSAQDEDEVVRITSNLVQVDAVVTDKDGKQVTDLQPEDFEILEDGRPQAITNFSYISTEPGATAQVRARSSASSANRNTTNAPPVPPARLRPEQVRRAVALVVDDLGLSFEATAYVRQYLKRFVEEQMRAGDLVAVVRTSAGVGALQQFSSDKRQVLAAIERVRFYPGFRAPTGSFAERGSDAASSAKRTTTGGDGERSESKLAADADAIADYRENLFSVGTLGALNFVVRGMRGIPGRKSVVLISENLRIFNPRKRNAPVLEYLRRLADLANRASVSIYNFNAGDLKPSGLSDEDSIVAPTILGIGPGEGGGQPRSASTRFEAETLRNEQRLGDGRAAFYESHAGLRYLAQQTGGASNASLERILEDQKGYYLIGYRPSDSTFETQGGERPFRNITIKTKRPGLRVRHRIGFYALPEEAVQTPAPATREGQLLSALTSPFASGSIRMRLTSLFGNDQQTGSFVRSLLYIDARDLSFVREPGGFRKAVIDVLALTFGDTGKAIDEVNRIETIRVSEDDYQKLLRNGLLYTIKVPIKKAGAYQLRVAVRDSAASRTGSANEFIEAPDVENSRLALSGIVLSGRDPNSAHESTLNTSTASNASQTVVAASDDLKDFDPQANPAVRRLRPGMELRYDLLIYNAQLDPSTNRPQLKTQVHLFREGKLLYEGRLTAFETAQQSDLGRLRASGRINLSSAAVPGEYVLQLVVTDELAKEKYRTLTQWIDFEIVR